MLDLIAEDLGAGTAAAGSLVTRPGSSTPSACWCWCRWATCWTAGSWCRSHTTKGWFDGGPSGIDVTVSLQGGEADDVEVQPSATDTTSLDRQRRFASGIGQLVAGRPLMESTRNVVRSSSSTAVDCDDAVLQIAAEAAE